MHPVAANAPALPDEQDMQALVAETRSGRRQFAEPLSQGAAVARLRSVVPGRVPETDQRARAADAELETVPYPSRDISTLRRGQIFFLTTSCRMCRSSVRSATTRFNRAFSSRSCRSSRISSNPRLP